MYATLFGRLSDGNNPNTGSATSAVNLAHLVFSEDSLS